MVKLETEIKFFLTDPRAIRQRILGLAPNPTDDFLKATSDMTMPTRP
jgi:hypothetical protein